MTPTDIQQLLALPITGVLIWILIRAEKRVDELMVQIINIQSKHTTEILQASGKLQLRFRSTDKIDPAVLEEIQKRVN